MHRVRASERHGDSGKGRYSVPFFFEPGADCVVRSAVGEGESVVYGEHVLEKMKGWVEFQDVVEEEREVVDRGVLVEAY